MSTFLKVVQPDKEQIELLIDCVKHADPFLPELFKASFPKVLGLQFAIDLDSFEVRRLSRAEKKILRQQISKLSSLLKKLVGKNTSIINHFDDLLFDCLNIKHYQDVSKPSLEKSFREIDPFTTYLSQLKLSNISKVEKNVDQLKLVLVSACVNGGLVHHKQLEALYDLLTSKTEIDRFFKYDEIFYFNLLYVDKSHKTSEVMGVDDNKVDRIKEYKSSRRWIVDPITRVYLFHFFENKNNTQNVAYLTFEKIVGKIKKDIFGRSPKITAKKVFSLLFKAAQWSGNIELAGFLTTYASGEVHAASTSNEYLHDVTNSKPLIAMKKIELQKTSAHKKVSNISESNCPTLANINDKKPLYDLLTACETETDAIINRGIAASVARNNLITFINSQKTQRQSLSLPARILFDFIADGILQPGRWQPGKRTHHRYLSIILEPWLDTWQSIDISEVDDEKSLSIYDNLLQNGRKNHELFRTLLPAFYKFISQKYSEFVETPNDGSINRNKHVRSMIISESVYQLCRQHINSLYTEKSNFFKTNCDLILILAFRTGMRPSEILNLKLSHITDDATELLVVSGKSSSARRKIPLSTLLEKEEFAELKTFFEMRRYQAKTSKASISKSFLFTQELSDNVKFTPQLINEKVTEFLSNYYGQRTVFYQYRHTLASRIYVICFCSDDTSKKLTHLSYEHIKRIRHYFSANERSICINISTLMGHLEESTTIDTYTHLLEYCLFDAVKNKSLQLKLREWARVLSVKTSRLLQSKISDAATSYVEINEMMPIINKKLQKFAQHNQQTSNSYIEKFQLTACNAELGLDELFTIGRMRVEINDSEEIASALGMDETIVANTLVAIDNVLTAQKYTTVRGKSTLVSKKHNLAAGPGVSCKSELEEVKKLFDFFNKKEGVNALALSEVFMQTPLTHNYVIFSQFKELKKRITSLRPVIDGSRWMIVADLPVKQVKSVNLSALKKLAEAHSAKLEIKQGAVSVDKYPNGRFKLRLLVPTTQSEQTEQEVIHNLEPKRPNGTNTIKCAAFWSKVYLMAMSVR